MIITFLVFIGAYAMLWYLCENLSSPIEIIVNFFTLSKKKTLTERYGEWAGEHYYSANSRLYIFTWKLLHFCNVLTTDAETALKR
jgi:hypothetical protein